MVRLAAVLLLVPFVASAEPVRLFDPPRKDDTPTAFACTGQTLASGEQCVFEGQEGEKLGAAQNLERLRALAEPACQRVTASASSADRAVLQESCQARVRAAAEGCAREGALVDAQGRFTTFGRGCYRALSEARAQSESLANAAPGCCACLATHRCGGAGSACVAQAVKASLAVSCPSDDCAAACAELLSTTPAPAKPAPRGKRAK